MTVVRSSSLRSRNMVTPAVSTFDQARMSFQVGDYQQALSLTDQALAKMPNDAAMHEFRALCLFALQRYDEAAESVRRGYTKARREAERIGGDVNDYVKENPGKSILIAAGVGFLIGLLVSRSRDND